jgi:hypothetical protein
MYCGQRSRVPDGSLGTSGQCPRCGAYFTLVPEEESTATGSGLFRTAGAPAAEPAPPLAGMPQTAAPIPPGNEPVPPASRRQKTGWLIVPLGVCGLFLCGVALLSASLAPRLVMPLSGLGVLIGLTGLVQGRLADRGRLLLPLAAATASAAVLLVAWLWPGLLGPRYEASRPRWTQDPEAMRVLPLPGGGNMEGVHADWVDASRAALQQGRILVRVSRAWIGTAQAPEKKAATRDRYLFLGLQIIEAKTATGKSGPAQEPTPPGSRPRLTDDSGKAFELRLGVTPSGDQAKGPDPSAFFREDVLAFVPVPAVPADLRLEMPAGNGRAFRFTIPAKMIHPDKSNK